MIYMRKPHLKQKRVTMENPRDSHVYLQQALLRHLMGSDELVGHCGDNGMLGMVIVFNITIYMITKTKQIYIT